MCLYLCNWWLNFSQKINFPISDNSSVYQEVYKSFSNGPRVCDVCKKSFSCTADLRRHVMIHTGEKPYACEVCGKRFNRLGNKRTHMMTHMPYMNVWREFLKPQTILYCLSLLLGILWFDFTIKCCHLNILGNHRRWQF